MHGFANNYGWLPEPLEPFAIFNRLSKSPSSNTVETVRCRHFSAWAARAASACFTRFSASTPRISRTGTSSLSASCRITSAIFRGSASAGQQGEDQKHYECALFSCDQVGVDREESNHECSPERETAESTGRSDSGRNHGIPQGIARSTPDDDRVGCFHWAAPRRTDRASVAGRGFRKSRLAYPSICSGNGRGCAENGSVSKRRSAGRANGRISLGMEAPFSIRKSRRLVVCLSAHERPTALLAR